MSPENSQTSRMKAHEFIQGFELVLAHLGLWPSFHDAEVLKLVID